ncbi:MULTISPECIES: hypothetical protein [Arthrospira]|uniref:Uncharacterized protein n=1 Tax=Limnospira platensis NIES-46 TaxID=1236695 RepID=A0A5M3T960_LIMPL|nr:hypothetical protein [Arthrospira platensis]AMW30608.1 hypothetical protein AP285_24355 [Arthrospira platensis YZ]KDR56634.1 hypothetical protein APPUASWS_015470 [Arthrospira platensis str. Paraca]MBD2671939.1 hypothetical protein [Arthrospira platensis FACHB-439]MBD2712884.1 hypothetical protein [Arthrospira platensis FACHB-835]MDF2207426.1 hypothetical protein [Arthrospira platensis NCB002]MDT9185536.1 hypothetical protein [Limnospira sp. PMC 289.06]MDT9297746.1 hypothetical protein [Ar
MTQTLDITGLTPEQIEQIHKMIETFKTINQQQKQSTRENISESDLNSLFFASEILQPFNRTMLYGRGS